MRRYVLLVGVPHRLPGPAVELVGAGHAVVPHAEFLGWGEAAAEKDIA
jgi:hypothetical protein